jgi:hypothetical protein
MKFVADFDFAKSPVTLGMNIQVGDNRFYTLNDKAHGYRCQSNELLVITSITHSGDKLGILKDVCLVIDGNYGLGVGSAVQPGQTLGVRIIVKGAIDFRLPPAGLIYPIQVIIEATQYRVTDIT